MNKLDAWMPLYVGDYLADTSRLTTEQHGAYLLILMDYWRNGPPLDDDKELAVISKLSLAQWRKHAEKIRGFFQSEDGRLIQKRADAEKQRAGHVSAKRSEAGKQGANKRWGKDYGKPIANAMANAIANEYQTVSQNGTQSQSQSQLQRQRQRLVSVEPAAAALPEVVEKPSAPQNPPPPPNLADADRAEIIANRLQKLEEGRGKVCRVSGKDPRVRHWVKLGLSDPDLREAYELAVQRRMADSDQAAINVGFLDVFVGQLINPPDAQSVVSEPKAWHEINANIEAKGKEHGLHWVKYLEAGKPWLDYKADVLKMVGFNPQVGA